MTLLPDFVFKAWPNVWSVSRSAKRDRLNALVRRFGVWFSLVVQELL
jgi:hypothetical protein